MQRGIIECILRSVARVKIVSEPTPLEPMRKLEARLFAEVGLKPPPSPLLWIKRDDRSWAALGGNKARKLEFIVGRVLELGAHGIVTPGMYGSNHAFATAVAARDFGLKVKLILGPQPVTEDVRKKLLAFHALGAELRYHGGLAGMGIDILRCKTKFGFRKGFYFVPPGGSSVDGILGYASAFRELLAQTGEAGLPERIVVPVGSGGTAAGLLLGASTAGVLDRVEIVGVGVAHPWFFGDRLVRVGAKRACRPLGRTRAFRYVKGYHAPGYGVASSEVLDTILLIKEAEALTLDSTYSGKAMHYLVDDVRRTLKSGGRLRKTVFWLTYNSFDLSRIIDAHPWRNPEEKWRELPKKFWPIFLGGS